MQFQEKEMTLREWQSPFSKSNTYFQNL